jgi:dihydroorotate dehydrogenase electron transfer subunit
MKENFYRKVRVERKKKEARDTESIYFRDALCAEAAAGQFIMVWLPGIDEFPMSISRIGDISSITVLRKGEGTGALLSLAEGTVFSIRGPFGNGFSEHHGKKTLIAGGIGIASLLPLVSDGDHVFLGARGAEYLPFLEEIAALGAEVEIATDDGSLGFRGTVVDLFLTHKSVGKVLACGPMPMLRSLYDKGVKAEASLESYMKCAVGICDSCTINGFTVCRDGPVVEDLRSIFEGCEQDGPL